MERCITKVLLCGVGHGSHMTRWIITGKGSKKHYWIYRVQITCRSPLQSQALAILQWMKIMWFFLMAFFHWVTGNFLLYQTVSGGFLLCSAGNKASLVGILIFICRGNHNFEIFVFLFRLKLKFMDFEDYMVAFTNKWSNLKYF